MSVVKRDIDAFTAMNARMRRIDLFCKLMGPLTVSLVAIASTEIAIWTTLGMNLASVIVEYVAIEQVYRRVSGLQRITEAPPSSDRRGSVASNLGAAAHRRSRLRSVGPKVLNTISGILPVESLPFYFSHPAFLASFALSLLYFTVLSFSGQMITYLASVGYTPLHIGIARVGSSVFEISATWAAPYLMKKIGVVRAGIWSLAWQMTCLAGVLAWYFSDFEGKGTNSIFSATGLAVGVALSRIGLWGFDLCAQNIIQDVSYTLAVEEVSVAMTTDLANDRRSRTTIEVPFLRWRRRSRTSLRYCLTSQRSSSQSLISFNGRWSSVSGRCIRQAGFMHTS